MFTNTHNFQHDGKYFQQISSYLEHVKAVNMMNREITILQLYMIFIISMSLNDHVMLIPYLLEAAGRDAWISLLLAFVMMLPFMLLIISIQKTIGQENFSSWMKRHYGATHYVIKCIIALWFFVNSFITLKDVVNWTKVSFLELTPTYVISLCFVAACYYSTVQGIRTLAIVASILLPAVSLLGFVVGIGNIPEKNYGLLKPILEYGITPALNGTVFVNAGIMEMVVLLFLSHHARGRMKLWHLVVILFSLIGVAIGPVTASVAEFGYHDAIGQRFPAFEQWRLLRIGRYIGHMDFLAIFQWLSGAFIRISLGLFLTIELLGIEQIKQQKKHHMGTLFVSLLLFLLTLIPLTDIQFTRYLKMYLPISLIVIAGLMLVILGLSLKSKMRRSRT
jgi:spore germination protein (amino acid permease)